jgi:hypothetical protein
MAVEVSHEKFVVGNYSDRKEKKKKSCIIVDQQFWKNLCRIHYIYIYIYIQVLGIHQLLQHHPTKIFSQV